MFNTSFKTLISARQLSETIIEHPERDNWIIVDCRFSLADPEQGIKEYKTGHLPGAFYAHLDNDLSAPTSKATGRHPLPNPASWFSTLQSWGLNPQSQVIVYDHGSGAVAARLWWMLRWSGHRRVALLDGGFRSWQEAGLPVETETAQRHQESHLTSYAADDALWIDTQQLIDELPRITLLDARSPERFYGRSEPIDPVAGHIPGAINIPLEQNLDQNGKFLPAGRLRQRFLKLGGLGENLQNQVDIVHMCGSGVTACHNILAMEIAGLTGSRLYVGSWSEWIRDPTRPIAVEER